MAVAPSITWLLVRIRPEVDRIIPVPAPSPVPNPSVVFTSTMLGSAAAAMASADRPSLAPAVDEEGEGEVGEVAAVGEDCGTGAELKVGRAPCGSRVAMTTTAAAIRPARAATATDRARGNRPPGRPGCGPGGGVPPPGGTAGGQEAGGAEAGSSGGCGGRVQGSVRTLMGVLLCQHGGGHRQ